MRVVSVVGARPQFVKLAPVAQAFKRAGIEHKIVHTGQHYDVNMSDSFFADLGIPEPDRHLGVGSGGHGAQTGRILELLDPVFEGFAPDWVLVYGDTNSTLAAAVSAVKLHIPLAHLEAGLRSFNRRMPEEHNRVLTDHAADLCLAPTEVAMRHLASEGLADRSVLVGDVMVDVLYQVRDSLGGRAVSIPGLGSDYVLATIHRAENTDDPERLSRIVSSLSSLPVQTLLPAHPRLRARAQEFGIELAGGSLVVCDPLAYPDLVAAVMGSRGVVTDSGGLQKEAFLLGKVCTTLRTETEWVETVELGWNVLDADCSKVGSLAAREAPAGARPAPYGAGHAADEVARVLASRESA